jgi:hypothetical protein
MRFRSAKDYDVRGVEFRTAARCPDQTAIRHVSGPGEPGTGADVVALDLAISLQGHLAELALRP